MEYINKRWDLPTMEKKLENLKKIINPSVVDMTIWGYMNRAENRLDALYLAYYELKDIYCKVKRKTFGKPKSVDFEPKKQELNGTASSVWWSPSDYTWTVTTSSGNTVYTYDNYYNTYTTSATNWVVY